MFEQSALKIARARHHLKDLGLRLGSFLDERPYATVHEGGTKPNERVIRAKVGKSPDPELAIVAGEVVHHLRSALDYAIGELIQRSTGSRPDPNHKFEFPIFLKEREFGNAEWKTRGIPESARALIERMQPYKAVPPQKPEFTALWQLHRLDIEDKHRALTILGGGMALVSIRGTGPGGADMFSIAEEWLNPGWRKIEDGTVLCRYFAAPHPESRMEFTLQVQMQFGSPDVVEGAPVIDGLRRLVDATVTTLGLLAEPFP